MVEELLFVLFILVVNGTILVGYIGRKVRVGEKLMLEILAKIEDLGAKS